MTDDEKLALFAASAYAAILVTEKTRDPSPRGGGDYAQMAQQAWIRARTLLDAEPHRDQN